MKELFNEKKEMETKIKDLELANEKLKLNEKNAKSYLDHSKWREWSTENVYKFIINIFNDDRLDKYKNSIYNEIFESQYKGIHLKELDMSELKQMGIQNIGIRRDVFRAIKQLTQNNNFNNDVTIGHGLEGVNQPTAYI